MSKIEKLRNRLSGERDTIEQFLHILRLDGDVMYKNKAIHSAEMKGDKSVLGSNIEVGDEFYFSMTTETIATGKDGFAGEISIRLNKLIKSEFYKYMLDPARHLRQIVSLNNQDMTYRIDRSRVSNVIVKEKMTREEVKECVEFHWFESVLNRYKKQK